MTGRALRTGLLAATIVFGIGGHAAAMDAEHKLAIGVRADAAPFSFAKGGSLIKGGRGGDGLRRASDGRQYDGYVVRICAAVMRRLQRDYGPSLQVEVVEVNAADRFEKLRSGEIDILCDPATITDARVGEFTTTMPVYLSGISFAAHRPESMVSRGSFCKSIVGIVGGTTAEFSGVYDILVSGEWPRFRDALQAMLNGQQWETIEDTDCAAANAAGKQTAGPQRPVREGPPIRTFDTHVELARAFCAGEILYYVADVEIIQRNLDEACEGAYVLAKETYADQRYGIFARTDADRARGNAPLILEFYSVLAQLVYASPSILIDAFNETFAGYDASRKLNLLYWSLLGPFKLR